MRNGTSMFRKPQGGRESCTGPRYRDKLAGLEIESRMYIELFTVIHINYLFFDLCDRTMI